MRFSSTTIVPKGRTKYGEYMAAGNVANSVSKVVYYGNNSTTEIVGGGDSGTDTNPEQSVGFFMFLSKTSNNFEGTKIAIEDVSDTTTVVGYRGNDRVCTYLYDLDNARYANEDDYAAVNPDFIIKNGVVLPLNYGIQNLPSSGMTVSVTDNGTSATTLTITIDRTISSNSGSIMIPAYVYLKEYNDMGDNAGDWFENVSDCQKMWLEYQWSIIGSADNNYILDLTNDSAGINVDSSGNVLAGATKPTCKATLYYGQEVVSGATFGISTPEDAAATGVSFYTSTDSLTLQFADNFNFQGTSLEISVYATYMGHTLTKIMTVSKNYPGADGTGATTRWIVPSVSAIKVDPNTGTITPATVTAKVMKQVGEDEPVEDSTTTIWYGWETDKPNNIYSSPIPVVAAYPYLALGLKNGEGDFYELETIPILEDGVNGSQGANGQSVYRLDLSNESAAINCDINGNLLPGAVRPKCTATLYYGVTKVTGAVYSLGETYADGLTINGSSGEITVGNDFTWEGTSIGIVVNATANKILRGTATFTLSKNFPGANGANGADGTDAVNYWLAAEADAIQVSSGGTASPSTISCKAYKQVGGNTPVELTSAETPYIYYGYNTKNPSTRYSGETLTIDETKNYLTFRLWDENNNTQYDIETIPILHDGKNGQDGQGRQGAAIRGPVEWLSTAARRWCSGNGNASGVSMEEDYQYIDIVFRIVDSKKVYYVCTKSYTQTANTDWSTVSSFWTQTDEQYEFVASKVLLADNAYIDFLTGNEIYLRDSGGTVTAGAAGGNGISFWAGNNQPGDAPFQVNYDGSLKSTKGTFGCLTIGEDNSGHSSFFGHTVGDGYEYELNMSPAIISFKGAMNSGTPQEVAEVVAICPSRNDEYIGGGDYSAAITIESDESTGTTPAIQKIAIYTNETIKAARLSQKTNNLSKNMESMPAGYGGAVSTPGLFGLNIVFQTSTPSAETYFTKDVVTGTWKFLEMDTGFPYKDYPYVAVQNSVSAMDADNLGYWAYYKTENGGKIWSGIAGPNIIKKNGVMYIQI